jgi:hypothetical protein
VAHEQRDARIGSNLAASFRGLNGKRFLIMDSPSLERRLPNGMAFSGGAQALQRLVRQRPERHRPWFRFLAVWAAIPRTPFARVVDAGGVEILRACAPGLVDALDVWTGVRLRLLALQNCP